MWKSTHNSCDLKSEYVPSESTIPCTDCVAFSKGGSTYLKEISHSRSEDDVERKPGAGGVKSHPPPFVRTDEGDIMCRVSTGYDLPSDDIHDTPLDAKTPAECCYKCSEDEGKSVVL